MHAVSFTVPIVKCMIPHFNSRREEILMSKLKFKPQQRMPSWSQKGKCSDMSHLPSECIWSCHCLSHPLYPICSWGRHWGTVKRECPLAPGGWPFLLHILLTFQNFSHLQLQEKKKKALRKKSNHPVYLTPQGYFRTSLGYKGNMLGEEFVHLEIPIEALRLLP